MSVPATRPDASRFSTTIDNPFMTLRPGTTCFYENRDAGESNTVTVTRDTVVIDGVACVVVHDVAYRNGLVIEDTDDWYAQDDQGNVWYFGEATAAFEPGNPVPDNTDGSWVSGVDRATAGIVMLANPDIGDTYRQGFAPGVAEDKAKVLSLEAVVNVAYGSFDEGLKTRDINPLDPSVENRFYAEGVGNLLTTNADGEYEQLVRIEMDGTGRADILRGYDGGDVIRARGGSDLVNGADGNDILDGGGGNDTLSGGEGWDRLHGGRGDDQLRGGQDGDTFVFRNLCDGVADLDIILDYRRGLIDVIDIRGGVASILAETFVDGVWELTLKEDGDRIRLLGVVDQNADGHVIDDLLFA